MSKKPVLFINPPRRHDGTRSLFNNATLTLASFLTRNGRPARTYSASGPDWKYKVAGWIKEHDPDFVAISCKWWDTLYGALQLAKFVKSVNPEIKCVMGGQTATSFASDIVAKTDFDAVIKGDGEQPLLDYVRGEPKSNLITADGVDLPVAYVQSNSNPEDLRLLDDLTEIADPLLLKTVGHAAPYIWTGKGCRCACLFCGGSALGQKKLFGRKGYLYRPIDHVLHDIETLAPWSDNTVMFDFDPIADPAKADYYKELFEQMPDKKYHLFFYSWSLPSLEFVESLDDKFASTFLSLDAQCYSERLRKVLADKNQLKPFRPNQDFEATVARIAQSPNMESGLYGIIGLAGEQQQDVQAAFDWTGKMVQEYGHVLSEVSVTPLSTEPGALLDRNPEKYGMVVCRKTFEDYVAFTGHQFYTSDGIHHAEYDPLLPHPYGVYSQAEHPGRVHQHYHQLREFIDQNMNQVHQARSADCLKFFTDRVGLKLHSRSRFYNPWTLISWGVRNAIERGYPMLEVDAKEAHILCPTVEVLKSAELDPPTEARLNGLSAALSNGFKVRILSTSDSFWGLWEELGAEVVRG
ncbi:MAG: cobalamin-dependent protein [Candidatus Eremiobacteraeota bacterium]|nr:cobalamin-dependent protein [Candidatus Eremiobacteraeota bacterium]